MLSTKIDRPAAAATILTLLISSKSQEELPSGHVGCSDVVVPSKLGEAPYEMEHGMEA
jgi:hypothetical protein